MKFDTNTSRQQGSNRISYEMIQMGLKKGRGERSDAFFRIFGQLKKKLSMMLDYILISKIHIFHVNQDKT